MPCKIQDIEYYLPENVLANKDIVSLFNGWEEEKIQSKLGIVERRIAGDNETSLDLAYEAASLLLKRNEKQNIDGVIFCTQSPDYYLPTSACITGRKYCESLVDITSFRVLGIDLDKKSRQTLRLDR